MLVAEPREVAGEAPLLPRLEHRQRQLPRFLAVEAADGDGHQEGSELGVAPAAGGRAVDGGADVVAAELAAVALVLEDAEDLGIHQLEVFCRASAAYGDCGWSSRSLW